MPSDDARPDAVEIVRRFGGTADWRDILRWSTPHSIRRAVAEGKLRRTSRGTYALPEAPPALQAAAAMRGVVSHQSAAESWRLETLHPAAQTHVTVPRRARPEPRKGVVVHYVDLGPSEQRDGATSPLRTVLDCAATMPFPDALAIADSALRRGLLDAEELVSAALRQTGPGSRRMARVATNADARADNPFESALRAIVLDTGLTGFEPQFPVRLGEFTARVDLADERRRIVLEGDSFEYHGSRAALERDCRRYNLLVSRGWRVLRFAWEHVMFDPRWVAAVVVETCALREGSPPHSA